MRLNIVLALFSLATPPAVNSPVWAHTAAPPCTTATEPCERWVTFDGGPARSMVYASYPLDVANPAITRALIMVHGAGRNADHYFETSTAAGFLAGALENTLIIAVSDNGGSAEGGPNGTFNEWEFFNGLPSTVERTLPHIDELGTPASNNHYNTGWAWAFDTPFPYWKR